MMPWLKHKKDDEPEVGIVTMTSASLSKMLVVIRNDLRRCNPFLIDLSGVRAKITSVQLNVKLKSC